MPGSLRKARGREGARIVAKRFHSPPRLVKAAMEQRARLPLSLFFFAILYGGMVCMAGVLGVKQVALGPLAVEAGVFAFLLLVVMSSAVAELYGQRAATLLVRFGFVPLFVSAALIQIVLALPADPSMYPPAVNAFPIVVGQGVRLMLAGFISYGTSQTLNVLLFDRLRAGTGQMVWLRGMIASIASQILDTVLFITIGFLGERPILALMGGQMLTKVVLSVALVPVLITLFVRLGRWLDQRGPVV